MTKAPTDRLVRGANLIAGHDSRAGSDVFHAIDPRTGEPDSIEFRNATPAEIEAAATAATEACAGYAAFSPDRTASLLSRIADSLDANATVLVGRAESETGLTGAALRREMQRTTWQFRNFAAVVADGWHLQPIIDLPDPDFIPAPRPDLRRMQVPLGPVVVFAASNVPFAFGVSGGDTASALAAGCPVIVKANPSHPGTSEALGRIISESVQAAGAPDGLFSVLHGATEAVGQELVRHPAVQAVGFTGSLRVGRALYDLASARPDPIPVYAEMGSLNPTFVTQAALRARAEEIAVGWADSILIGTGQFCTKPGIIVVPEGADLDRFIVTLADRLQAAIPGVLLNQRIHGRLTQQLAATVAIPGVEQVAVGAEATTGFAFAPRVYRTSTGIFLDRAALREEHFGPVAFMVTYNDESEINQVGSAVPNSLTATVHAESADHERTAELERLLMPKVGRLIYNGFPTGVAVTHAMQHGGPFPATTASTTTSVGTAAIFRFMRPVTFQSFPQDLLPAVLRNENPLRLGRLVNGSWTTDPVLANKE